MTMVRGGGRGGAIKRVMIEEKPSPTPTPTHRQDSVAQLPTMTVCVGCQTLTKRIDHLERRVADLIEALCGGSSRAPHTRGMLISEGAPIVPISKETLDNLRHHLPLRGYSVRR
jgi:hypothetical protein